MSSFIGPALQLLCQNHKSAWYDIFC